MIKFFKIISLFIFIPSLGLTQVHYETKDNNNKNVTIENITSDIAVSNARCPFNYPLNNSYSIVTNSSIDEIKVRANHQNASHFVTIDTGWHGNGGNKHLTVWVEPSWGEWIDESGVTCHVYENREAKCGKYINEYESKNLNLTLQKGSGFNKKKYGGVIKHQGFYGTSGNKKITLSRRKGV